MIQKIKQYISNEKYKKIISNFSYLSVINIANKILPILVIPYIVRTIGIEKFGIITFAWVIISYVILVSKYSFELTAVKYISYHRKNIYEVSYHLWLVMITRFLLVIGVLIVFLIALVSIDSLYNEKMVMLFTFIAVFADIFMPLCFFRGMEEMKYIAIFNIVSKLLYTVSIFIFIHNESDYIWIPILNSITLLMVSIYALYYSIVKFNLIFIIPEISDIFKVLNDGKDIFLSNINVSFYTTINPILLGILGGYTSVGIYTLAEAIFNAYTSIIKNYTMVIYPHLSRYVKKKEKLYTQIRKFFFLYLFILFCGALILYLFSPMIITFLYGSSHRESIIVLQILAISLLLEPLGGFFTSYMSLKSEYIKIRIITWKTMLVNILLVIPMIYLYDARGLAYLFLILSLIQVYLNISANREILFWKEKI